jgi:ubiquinone/menaquinone biosynthesis C-methylase UbiE
MDAFRQAVVDELKKQIAQTAQALREAGYDEAPTRARVVRLARRYRGPVLDVGTGACACMAVALARRGLTVTAIDHTASAVRLAQERAAGKLGDALDVRHVDAAQLPFVDKSYAVVVAFDALCHAPQPAAVLSEMFRVSSGVVIVTELNAAGRQVMQHHDHFDQQLPDLLTNHCQACQMFQHRHHTTYVCDRRSWTADEV